MFGRLRLPDPALLGTLFSLASAVGYTLSNASLRSVADCDPFLVTAVKAAPTVALASPAMIWLACRGRPWRPREGALLGLALAAIWGHWGGNVAFQWSLRVIGMALAVPLTTGAMILGVTWMGALFLNERVTARNWRAMALMIVAICVLSSGAREANRSVGKGVFIPSAEASDTVAAEASSVSTWEVFWGVLAACEAGLSYAALESPFVAARHRAPRPAPH